MPRGIKLRRSAPTTINEHYHVAHRLRVDVVEAEEVPTEIFLYNRLPPDAGGTVYDRFLTVCKAADLADYPAGEPDAQLAFPFFRLSYIELDFLSSAEANEVWEVIKREVEALVESLDRLEILQTVEEVVCGEFTGESEESDDSE